MADASARVDDWERHLSAPFRGRQVICAFEVLAAMTGWVAKLQRWGAERPLLISDGVGTGPLPLETEADAVVLDHPPNQTLTEQVRARMSSSWLTEQARAAVEAYDPAGEAVWWVSPPAVNEPLMGRAVLGGRPRKQAALEDKLAVDAILDAVGATRAASVAAPARHNDLLAASRAIGAEVGSTPVVWAGDARDGINGGGDYVRLIRTTDQAQAAAQFFSASCDQVRVSSWLEGIPCSVHGLVLPDGVVTLRPLELASLRDDERGRFVYAGMGTGWDPPAADTDDMRALARLVGAHLAAAYGYRGAYGIDGVLTTEGFRVTELNPRFSGVLTMFSRVSPSTHLDLVQVNAVIGRDVGRSAADIEQAALADLDASRFADVMGLTSAVRPTRTSSVMVSSDGERLVVTEDEDVAIGVVSFGPASTGGFVRLALADGTVMPGQRTAPLAVVLFELADALWGTGFGSLSMPIDARV
ncbi:MAG TPA: ATP-grasp domain-containing protein [Nocardioidaceae bacterium]|nr:ATP-grasp domain-containing protein [Nocardioidaceae bacterium]